MSNEIVIYRKRNNYFTLFAMIAAIAVGYALGHANEIVSTYFPGTRVFNEEYIKTKQDVTEVLNETREGMIASLLPEGAVYLTSNQVNRLKSEVLDIQTANKYLVQAVDLHKAEEAKLNSQLEAYKIAFTKQTEYARYYKDAYDNALVKEKSVADFAQNRVVTPVKAAYSEVKQYEVHVKHAPQWVQDVVGYGK
jgi:hypothetical protein